MPDYGGNLSAKGNGVLGWGDSSVGKELGVQVWGLEFRDPEPAERQAGDLRTPALLQQDGRQTKNSLVVYNQSAWSAQQWTSWESVSNKVEGKDQPTSEETVTSVHMYSRMNTHTHTQKWYLTNLCIFITYGLAIELVYWHQPGYWTALSSRGEGTGKSKAL